MHDFLSMKRDVLKALSVINFKKYDLSTAEGLKSDRLRRTLLMVITAMLSKAMALVSMLITIPMTLDYLGVERFGIWMIFSTLFSLLAIFDLGVGSSITNLVANAIGKNREKLAREIFYASGLILGVLSILLLILFNYSFDYMPWLDLLGIQNTNLDHEIRSAVYLLMMLFFVGLPSTIIFKYLTGLQKGWMVNLWYCLISIFTLVGNIVSVRAEYGLQGLVTSLAGAPLLVSIICTVYLVLSRNRKYLTFTLPTKNTVRAVSYSASMFFLLQISVLIAFQSDTLIISHYLGASDVAVYAVAFKLFSVPTMILGMLASALWPTYSEAIGRGDHAWVRHMFLKSIRYSMFFNIPVVVLLVVFSPYILDLWVGQEVVADFSLRLGLGLWAFLTIFGSNFSAILNSMQVMRFQAITSMLMAVSSISLSIFLVQYYGVAGVVFGSVISLVLVLYIPSALLIRRRLL